MNEVEVKEYFNFVEVSSIDIETSKIFISQFQITEEHEEAD